jgi:exosortase D (VPLPA-CTERM-specific)
MQIGGETKIQKFGTIATGLSLTIAVLWLYWPILSRLIISIAENEDYSYGLLLPLVSGYVVYLKWPQLRNQAWQPSWVGLIIIASGLGLLIIGELAAELYTTRFSFMVVLAGLLWLLGGWKLVRLMAFPLILLVLMLPLPELVTYKLTLPLQLVSSQLATAMLRALGVPVLRQGNIIDLGVRQLQIVAACSGLRYILALLALGIIYCYFFQRRVWKVAVLLLAIIPAAIMVNALRVVGMALSPALLKGFWHIFSGWLIFLLCFAFLALINLALNGLWPDIAPAHSKVALQEEPPLTSRRKNFGPYLLAALALLLLAIPVVHRVGAAPPIPLRQSFNNFPMRLGPWEGKHAFIDPAMVEATRSQAHLNADYQNPDHGSVNVWVAYYETQKKAGGFVHSPKGCLTASGWKITASSIIEITPGRPVNYLLVEQMGTRMVVFYWFLQRGRWLASEYLNKFYMGYDGLLRRRTDGALVRLITPAGRDQELAKERLISFTNLLIPVLPQFIPD